MKVRVLFGQRAGDVVDYPVHIARRLLADGRAVSPETDVTVAAPTEAVTSTVAPGVQRRRRS